MENLRLYGIAPYTIAVVHGGPGAAGELAPVAEQLSCNNGVLEPLQTATSLEGQIEELYILLKKNGHVPLTLIGFSWGAWLSYIFTALHPAVVKKLILISCGPFEEKDAARIMETRLQRLSIEEKNEISSIQETLEDLTLIDKNTVFERFGELIFKADSYDPLPNKHTIVYFDYELFRRVWPEADELRRCGKLLLFGKNIQCPVVAIHGEHDPHPAYAINNSLSKVCKDFRFILLKNCGHYPWIEKLAYKRFYDILRQEVNDNG
jgi:pimeloyl-ACP methyl ester carboxylesterase